MKFGPHELTLVRDMLLESASRYIAQPLALRAARLNMDDCTQSNPQPPRQTGDTSAAQIGKEHQAYLCQKLEEHFFKASCVGMADPDHNLDRNLDHSGQRHLPQIKNGPCFLVNPLDGAANVANFIDPAPFPVPCPTPAHGAMIAFLDKGQPLSAWVYYSHATNGNTQTGMVYGTVNKGLTHLDLKSGTMDTINMKAKGYAPQNGKLVATPADFPPPYADLVNAQWDKGLIDIIDPPQRSTAVATALFLTGQSAGLAAPRFCIHDHAALFALTKAAGGMVKMMDHGKFDAARNGASGILATCNADTWAKARQNLLAGHVYTPETPPPALLPAPLPPKGPAR